MSLFPALMFLLVLSMIGVSALNSTLMQEKMVANSKDLNIAFQAAEAGLRDAETDVSKNIDAGTAFSSDCVNGLCTPPSTWPSPTSADISKVIDWSDTSKSRAYGTHTNAPTLPVVAAQPQYVIERLSTLPVSAGGSVGLGCGTACVHSGGAAYRLTVLATGARSETRVILQSTYIVKAAP
jgi:type IV pilus assembly protein PilX